MTPEVTSVACWAASEIESCVEKYSSMRKSKDNCGQLKALELVEEAKKGYYRELHSVTATPNPIPNPFPRRNPNTIEPEHQNISLTITKCYL